MKVLPVKQLTSEVMAVLRRHSWPGNVRELRNTVEHAALVAAGDVIALNDLPNSVNSASLSNFASSSNFAWGAATFKERVREYEEHLIPTSARRGRLASSTGGKAFENAAPNVES